MASGGGRNKEIHVWTFLFPFVMQGNDPLEALKEEEGNKDAAAGLRTGRGSFKYKNPVPFPDNVTNLCLSQWAFCSYFFFFSGNVNCCFIKLGFIDHRVVLLVLVVRLHYFIVLFLYPDWDCWLRSGFVGLPASSSSSSSQWSTSIYFLQLCGASETMNICKWQGPKAAASDGERGS